MNGPRLIARHPERADYQVLWSPVEGVRGYSIPHWRAELFDHEFHDGFMSRPVAVAYVTEYEPDERMGVGPTMDYICSMHAPPDAASYLLARLFERWPGLVLTGRIDREG